MANLIIIGLVSAVVTGVLGYVLVRMALILDRTNTRLLAAAVNHGGQIGPPLAHHLLDERKPRTGQLIGQDLLAQLNVRKTQDRPTLSPAARDRETPDDSDKRTGILERGALS